MAATFNNWGRTTDNFPAPRVRVHGLKINLLLARLNHIVARQSLRKKPAPHDLFTRAPQLHQPQQCHAG